MIVKFKICKNFLEDEPTCILVISRRVESTPTLPLISSLCILLDWMPINLPWIKAKPEEQVCYKFFFLQDSQHHTCLHAD